MSLLPDNEKNSNTINSSKTSTFIAKEMEVTGNFKGKGTMQVEGILHGDIVVDSVIIGENATVNGNINAKNVVVRGQLKGRVECDSLQVMQNGVVSNKTVVKNLKILGKLEGELSVSDLLQITSTGYVHGDIILNKLTIEEGGKLTGSMKEWE